MAIDRSQQNWPDDEEQISMTVWVDPITREVTSVALKEPLPLSLRHELTKLPIKDYFNE